MSDIDFVFADQLLSVFRVKRDIGLAVVLLELDLAAEQATGRIDFLDRHRGGHHHRLAVGIENPGIVLNCSEFDRPIGEGAPQRYARR